MDERKLVYGVFWGLAAFAALCCVLRALGV